MKKWLADKYSIYFSDSSLRVIQSFKQTTNKHSEAGGILLGQVLENEIFVLKASPPNNQDKSNRYRFERDSRSAQIITNYEFVNSGSKTIYLGEWHTHPENFPTPSIDDKNMLKDQFEGNMLNEQFLLLAIQGLKDLSLYIYNGHKIQKCNKLDD